jgi:MFS family permease
VAGTLLTLVAFTVPLTTLTSTAAGLGLGGGAQAWLLSGMSLGSAVALLASGAIGDDHGRRRTFLAGAVVLAAASVLGALAPSALLLVGARVLQGVGGAAIVACSLGLIASAFPEGPGRARATGVWGAAIGAGVAIGPLVAGGLDVAGGWRLPYVATAIGAALLAAVGGALLRESRARRPGRVDLAGTLLLGVALAALLAGLIEGRSGWDRPATIGLLALGLVAAAAFTLAERRIAAPMLDLDLFRHPDFTGATAAALASGAGVLSLLSLIPTLLERTMGVGAILAAVVLLAWSATSALTALGARWLPGSVSPRAQLIGGLVGVAAGQLALAGLTPDASIWRLLPGMLVAGAANGVLNAALGRQAVATVPADRAAMGSGANNTARYLGSALGLTVVTVILTHAGGSGPDGLIAGWNVAAPVTAAISLAGAVLLLALRRPRLSRAGGADPIADPPALGESAFLED